MITEQEMKSWIFLIADFLLRDASDFKSDYSKRCIEEGATVLYDLVNGYGDRNRLKEYCKLKCVGSSEVLKQWANDLAEEEDLYLDVDEMCKVFNEKED